jgi:hypothetical protein
MKSHKIIFINLVLVSLLFLGNASFGQETGDSVTGITPNLSLNYVSSSDDSITLKANIYVRRETGLFSLENAEIDFSISNGEETLSLGTVKAGYDGNAVMKLAVNDKLLRDKEGKATYAATFKGNGNYLPAQESLTFKPGSLEISFSKEDSIHTLIVKAFQIEANNEKKPIQGATVNVYIPRMLSDLKIGEVELDENGEGTLEFTGGVVGDSLGNLVFIGRIEENDIFGTVQGKASISWGIPKQYFLAERPTRELWTPIAPAWMIITLIIMLAGVWGHYLYAIIQLAAIKRISRRKKEYL